MTLKGERIIEIDFFFSALLKRNQVAYENKLTSSEPDP